MPDQATEQGSGLDPVEQGEETTTAGGDTGQTGAGTPGASEHAGGAQGAGGTESESEAVEGD